MGVAATLPELSEWTLQPLSREQDEILFNYFNYSKEMERRMFRA